MIVAMAKTFIVARRADREALLAALRGLGVLHVKPVDPARAAPDAETADALDRVGRAVQILEATEADGQPPDVAVTDAADEVLRIQRDSAERLNRLSALHRQIEHLTPWGDVRLEQFQALAHAGIQVRFYVVPRDAVRGVEAECVQVVGEWDRKRALVAVVDRTGERSMPEGAEEILLPLRDRPALRAEAKEIDQALKADSARLRHLAALAPEMRKARAALSEKARWTTALGSALENDSLFALQGWVPAEEADGLARRLADEGVHAAVEIVAPAEDDEPPTLIRYPWWARPIKGLFDVLGTVPGYREFDVSAAFMIALPIFSAIMICDLGYGLVYTLLPIVFYRKLKAAGAGLIGKLVMVVGILAIVWGFLVASFFGYDVSPYLGRVPGIGPLYENGAPVTVSMGQEAMQWLMWLSILIGAIHLSVAYAWKAMAYFPHPRFLGMLGWGAFLWGVYGLVNTLVLKAPFFDVYLWLLVGGGGLALLFAEAQRNILKGVGLGLANMPLTAIGMFGDTISYLRLMAIGLAGTALAIEFNNMASPMPWYGMVPVLVLGHALNVVLSALSLLAHGVRLNMLEFSNNLGMTWSGYAYEPFSVKRT
ncbi:MAG: hypothetical protein ISS74_06130 [Planctomycetes bacterium]|nr:hypothetical protein [Planctomycetota bacterium]